MKDQMTRRQLAGVILTGATAAAQTTSSASSDSAGELESARSQNQRTGEALAKVPVPTDTEPAFHFSA
jgi:hypothetical protein